MADYALVKDNKVVNTVVWDGETEVDFGSDFLSVLIPDGASVSIGYDYNGKVFSAPELTEEQQAEKDAAAINVNTSLKALLMNKFSQMISVLQNSVDSEMATDDEARLLPLWKKYRVLLNRINANVASEIDWPAKAK
ncbi:tail fiber assembly protein [Pantoea anthophila]|uniref:tail fiber assembly protein n=1 Tax=Pantoea anthophila TaxID=470931 RepID=UPI00301E0B09